MTISSVAKRTQFHDMKRSATRKFSSFTERLKKRNDSVFQLPLRAPHQSLPKFLFIRLTGTMPLPLAVLKAALNRPIMVELKNGDTLSGVLVGCDGFMNLHMRDLVRTSRDGDRFWKLPECYVRGNNVKYLRLHDDVLNIAAEAAAAAATASQDHPGPSGGGSSGGGRGRRHEWQGSGRGRGRGRGAVDLSDKARGVRGRGRGRK